MQRGGTSADRTKRCRPHFGTAMRSMVEANPNASVPAPDSVALAVRGLKTSFFTRAGAIRAVDNVSFTVGRGRILGLVGESGSGKTVTGFSILGLVDPPGEIASGEILLYGENLVGLPESRLCSIRGARIAMIFQDPMMTLNPVMRIDAQMMEALQTHHPDMSDTQARALASEALVKVGISSPDERLRSYPHQFSGGMRQRIAIAIAFLNKPDVIVADEPTTALDVTIQAQILSEVQTLCRESGTALIWITHDLSVVAGLADDICVMYAGRIVESGPVADVLDRPLHPYTRGLLNALPRPEQRGQRFVQIPGAAPLPLNLPEECSFMPRCPRASEACRTDVPLRELRRGHSARCVHPLIAAS